MNEYISLKDTNSLIRKALKESFPSVKFSIRGKSYSGGASTTIRWTDGPNVDQVKHLISAFEAAYFDGMIDYKGSRYALLDGEAVHFGADFLFCERDHSPDFELRMVKRISAQWAHQCDYLRDTLFSEIITDYHKGHLYNVSPFAGAELTGGSSYTVQALIRNACSKHTFEPFPKHSDTLDRVAFKGDDGYGAGTVGPNGDGSGYGGYPSCQ